MIVSSVEKGVVFISPPLAGAVNMEIDEALLLGAGPDSPLVLRIYRWVEPTLSLGHFQAVPENQQGGQFEKVASVRRKTGGGAILHDGELTYSLIVPSRTSIQKGHSEHLYRSVHESIAAGLQSFGWNAVLSETCTCAPASNATVSNQRQDPFLCYHRRSPVDLVVGEHKIVGSAQRRTRQGLLQHGSLLLRRSVWTPDLLGLLDLPRSTYQPTGGVAEEIANESGLEQSDYEFWANHFLKWVKMGVAKVFECEWERGKLVDFPAFAGLNVPK